MIKYYDAQKWLRETQPKRAKLPALLVATSVTLLTSAVAGLLVGLCFLGTFWYWAIGIASAIILFASVLVHELSHSYIAKKNGLPIARITLFFFGGVSEMTEEPQDPSLRFAWRQQDR